MTATEQTIWETLVELDRLVKSMLTANPKPNLLPVFTRLDELTGNLPPDTAPELMHYLRKKSYASKKPGCFLEGRDAEEHRLNGTEHSSLKGFSKMVAWLDHSHRCGGGCPSRNGPELFPTRSKMYSCGNFSGALCE